jgi:hypothetical protein
MFFATTMRSAALILGMSLLAAACAPQTEIVKLEEILSECRGGDPVDYFLYDHRVLREPDSVHLAHTVVVVTSLYDRSTGNRIWTIQSTCFRKAELSEALVDEAKAIVRQLRFDRLI